MRTRLLAFAALLLALPACTSAPPDAAGCRDAPASCPAGTTCWPSDERGAFACLPSRTFKARGDDCELLAGRPGCNDGQICLTSDRLPDANAPVSYCTAYCDGKSGAGCQAGEQCARVALFDGVAASAVWACVELAPGAADGGPRD